MIERGAVFSPNGVYRYSLSRVWKREKGLVLFLLLNPSTADANVLDPTLRRCMSFAEAWGYGGILVGNIFALRSTDPQFLYLSRDPIGPTNDFYIKTMVEFALRRRDLGADFRQFLDELDLDAFKPTKEGPLDDTD